MLAVLKKAGIPLIIVLIAIVVAAAMINMRQPPEKAEVEERAFLVNAIPVSSEDLQFVVKSQGTVQPKIQTVLSAQVSGRVTSVAEAFIEGGMFKKGDVLVQLEQADYNTDLKTAQAELARAQAALEEERARGKVAEEEWRSVKGSVAPELGLRKPQLAKELASVRAAEAQLERAQRNLERTTIRAPYDGLVRSKDIDLGQFVTVGKQLGVIYNTDVAEVRMPLSDNDLAYLQLPGTDGQSSPVELTATVAGKVVQWQGMLARDEGILDEQRRVIYAVAEVKDPYQRADNAQGVALKFGRFVQARISGNRGDDMIVLPRHVLRLDGTVLVVGEDRKLEIRDVVVQRADENSVYISAGLRSGEQVITSAVPNPYNGMALRLPGDEQDPAVEKDVEESKDTAIAKTERDA
ncbi:efflux RND transporter periplasmic adaptor subunit [Aestuariibacter halophilus]|uniref:Efflux RND transporter periplasmic adaptor subunit n=1 Tax=Fluctibacter halophilus TaxID=226011 RepID=A0ABS8G4E7_9ALTE|nr:efflux RND transporter periplasmic adaptor subunit [Aestuariibacter halophilus]MCC2615379.1 efflux RND transporter periplasmic adaptor subunit [Aestuariibacter halophilus]